MDSDKQLDSAKASSIEVRTTTDRVDHASEKPERRLSHSTDASKNSGKKTAEKRADDRASPDAAEQPAKKMKRGKYISRAWYNDLSPGHLKSPVRPLTLAHY
ncbi:hypothetical protein VD0001_g272 [Verticillium dahliae]|nr:hypothetical protein VD0001_g272 [Verticillium dahliae]